MQRPWYQRGHRRMLVDMHIPDWDSQFLARYDPAEMVRLYRRAGLTSVMFYAQSHVGLCNWPTATGKMHAGLQGRDIVGETLRLLAEADIDAVGYYSVVYNNWAALEHPSWRMAAPAEAGGEVFSGGRYGMCCPNHPEYRSFVQAQLAELAGGYAFAGLFIDMTFWPRICVCDHCRDKLRAETGDEIPQTIDWFDPTWRRFQTARERWIQTFANDITSWAKAAAGGELAVYHNFATAAFNWSLGLSFEAAEANTFLGADFYGDPAEQLLVSKLMSNLSPNRPIEYMTSRCLTLTDHETNKTAAEIRTQALASTLFGGAMLFIDAIDPDGKANAAPYEMIRQVYDEVGRFEPVLGGDPVEDVAIYFSQDSKLDFAENGLPLADAPMWQTEYPHKKAVRGVCRALQEVQVPFGVITRKQLADLDRYKVVALPNVLCMDAEEAEAFRQYVRRGGCLYASRLTSLTGTRGVRHEDFMLADVFGCHVESDDAGTVSYVKPRDARLAEAAGAQTCLSVLRPWPVPGSPGIGNAGHGTVRLNEEAAASVLATLTLPYSNEPGSLGDKNWSSIHSSPPWRDTAAPAIVAHSFGEGRVVYSATDLESLEGDAPRRVLTRLLLDLLGDGRSASAEAHPCVWMSVADQPDSHRMIVGFLNYPQELPAIPIAAIPFTLRPPRGARFVSLQTAPDGDPIDFDCDADGVLHATLSNLEALTMLEAAYAAD